MWILRTSVAKRFDPNGGPCFHLQADRPENITFSPVISSSLPPPRSFVRPPRSLVCKLCAVAEADDTRQVFRVLCYLCLSPADRWDNQPHILPSLTDHALMRLVARTPEVMLLAAALLGGRATLIEAISFHLFHSDAVHSQVCCLSLYSLFCLFAVLCNTCACKGIGAALPVALFAVLRNI